MIGGIRTAAIGCLLVVSCGSADTTSPAPTSVGEDERPSPAVESSEPLESVESNEAVEPVEPVEPKEPDEPEATSVPAATDIGRSGLAVDLKGLSETELPRFIERSPIPAEDLVRVSRFRSAAGHDYSDSSSSCCSMKHYLIPRDYDTVRFSQPVVSPVDGVVVYAYGGRGENESLASFEQRTGVAPPAEYRDLSLFIRPDAAPNVWVRFFHVSPTAEILGDVTMVDDLSNMSGDLEALGPGHRVSAGDLIGVGLGELSIEQHLDGPGMPLSCSSSQMRETFASFAACAADTRFHSLFALMTDAAFDEFASAFGVTREDFIITEAERGASPLDCDGEEFVDRDVDAYVSLGSTEQSDEDAGGGAEEELLDREEGGLPSVEAIAAGGSVLVSASGVGSSRVTLNVDAPGLLRIAANGGPLALAVLEPAGPRTVHQRPDGAGAGVSDAGASEPGQLDLEVDAAEGVDWVIVVVG